MAQPPKDTRMMKMFARPAVCLLLAAVAPLALAVRPTEAVAPGSPSAFDTRPVERGGTIEAVDRAKRAIVIEGASYAIPLGSVPIHWPTNKVSGQWSDLKPGMQIRFNTVKDEARRQQQVREIWVTGLSARSPR
jgi:hypothetical protein